MRASRRLLVGLTSPFILATGIVAVSAPPALAASPFSRYVVVARTSQEYGQLRADAVASGASVVEEMPDLDTFVVHAGLAEASRIASDSHAEGVAADHVESLIQPEAGASSLASLGSRAAARAQLPAAASTGRANLDPAFALPGLMWDQFRVRSTTASAVTLGDPHVRVAVEDTGLDFTHAELASQVKQVVSFVDPTICKNDFSLPSPPFPSPHMSDADLAAAFGGPALTDWNGHGSWIGGNIAAALDGVGINGMAPKVSLVSIKISDWCGSAFDSSLIDGFLWAAKNHVDVVSISFGGYLDRSDRAQNLIYRQYQRAVSFANRHGTIIVAAAGNEHVRVGAGGLVLSHGDLTTPGTTAANFIDLFGLYEVPGGIPGVVDVSSTGNIVNSPSAACSGDTAGSPTSTNATCKPTSDPHQSFGIGHQNQLAYYSNYGPRIDVAGPGGARKFNLPVWDRGGTPGFPYTTADGFAAWEDFSITSNWAVEIPCFTFNGGGFPANQCYSSIQGTSMATPHASAVAALIASAVPAVRGNASELIERLKDSTRTITGNKTPGLSASDTSAGDLSGVACPTGYCHLGGAAISNREAYGAGMVDAYNGVTQH